MIDSRAFYFGVPVYEGMLEVFLEQKQQQPFTMLRSCQSEY